MGIKDANHILESWLLSLVGEAFYYALPEGFAPTLIVQDLTAVMVAAFHSTRVMTGDDFLRYLLRPIVDFGKADSPAALPIRWETNRASSAPEALDILVDKESEINAAAKDCVFVYARDDARFVPMVRRMLHDERYGTVDNGEGDDEEMKAPVDRPLSETEMRQLGVHICSGRLMPGAVGTPDRPVEAPNCRELRRRAANTIAVRSAYQVYGSWALVQELQRHTSPQKEGDANALGRAVLVDTVPASFDEREYTSAASLADLPPDWSKKSSLQAELIRLHSGIHLASFETPQVGETDLKLAWYTEHVASQGSHVLLRCNDSDVLFLLMLHAERWAEQGKIVFLDMMPRADARLKNRFVCLTELVRGLKRVAESKWNGLSNPAFVVAFLALLCGSDYTQSHYFIAARAVKSAFETERGLKTLRSLIPSFADFIDSEHNTAILQELLGKHEPCKTSLPRPVLPMMDEAAADRFLAQLYTTRIKASFLVSEIGKVRAEGRLSWEEIGQLTLKCFSQAKKSSSYTTPKSSEARAEVRRIFYTILYWANAHIGRGVYPNPLFPLAEDEEYATLWGWTRAPAILTVGSGIKRRLSPAVEERVREACSKDPNTTARQVISSTLLNGSYSKDSSFRDEASWVVCHTSSLHPNEALWNSLAAEWLANIVQ